MEGVGTALCRPAWPCRKGYGHQCFEFRLITPARDGTRRVLEASAREGVSRVVITSSTSAAMPAHPNGVIVDERMERSYARIGGLLVVLVVFVSSGVLAAMYA